MTNGVLDPGPALPAPPAPAGHPWRDEPALPAHATPDAEGYGPPPDEAQHGYLPESGPAVRCTRPQLLRRLRKEPWTPGVLLPGSPVPVRPESVPELVAEYRRALVRNAVRDAVLLGACTLGLGAWAATLWGEAGIRSGPGFMAVFFTAFLLLQLHGIRAARRVNAGAFPQARLARRHWSWVRAQPAAFTWALVVGLAVVALLTTFTDTALEGAGLVKPAVWDGQAWRMLTGPMLHAGVYHAWINLAALLALGRILEAHASRFHLVIAFLGAVVGGSVLSLLLSPRPSVGASGGVMGLVGFLWVLWRFHPGELPDDFGQRMKYVVGATALLGILGLEFIDNWAHLGGLLAGAGVGWLLLRGSTPRAVNERAIGIAGALAMAILVASMAGAVAGTWSATPDPGYDTRWGG